MIFAAIPEKWFAFQKKTTPTSFVINNEFQIIFVHHFEMILSRCLGKMVRNSNFDFHAPFTFSWNNLKDFDRVLKKINSFFKFRILTNLSRIPLSGRDITLLFHTPSISIPKGDIWSATPSSPQWAWAFHVHIWFGIFSSLFSLEGGRGKRK